MARNASCPRRHAARAASGCPSAASAIRDRELRVADPAQHQRVGAVRPRRLGQVGLPHRPRLGEMPGVPQPRGQRAPPRGQRSRGGRRVAGGVRDAHGRHRVRDPFPDRRVGEGVVRRQGFEGRHPGRERRHAPLRLGQDAQKLAAVGQRVGGQQRVADRVRDALGLLEIRDPLAGIAQPQQTAEAVEEPAALARPRRVALQERHRRGEAVPRRQPGVGAECPIARPHQPVGRPRVPGLGEVVGDRVRIGRGQPASTSATRRCQTRRRGGRIALVEHLPHQRVGERDLRSVVAGLEQLRLDRPLDRLQDSSSASPPTACHTASGTRCPTTAATARWSRAVSPNRASRPSTTCCNSAGTRTRARLPSVQCGSPGQSTRSSSRLRSSSWA